MVTPEVMMMPTLAVSLVFALDTAVMVTWEGLGTVAGGVYKPAVLTVPTVELPLSWPLTCHFKEMFEYPETSAVNCRVVPKGTMVVELGWRLMVIVAVVVEHVLVELPDVPVEVLVQLLPQPAKQNIQMPRGASESARPISEFSWRYRGNGTISTRLLF